MFSEINITTNYPRDLARYTTLLIDRFNYRGTSPNFGWKTRGYVQRWHLRYKTSDISEAKQSRANVASECLYKLVYGLPIWWQIWWMNDGILFRGANFFPQWISRTLFIGAQRNLAALGVWPVETYSPNFVNFGPGGVPWYHAATCISPSLMHL